MLLSFIAPLLYSSALYTAPITRTVTDETQEVHIVDKDTDTEARSGVGWNCVSYVISQGVHLPPGNAIDLQPNSLPRVGGVVIMRYDHPGYSVGHVALITKIDGQGYHVTESNVIPGEISSRVLSITDKHIVGFGYYQ